MRLNSQLLKINRNFIICFIASAIPTTIAAHLLGEYENYLNTTITIGIGYASFFGTFALLFYFDNKERYKEMGLRLIKKELLVLISSLGTGEIIYLVIRWPTMYYFLEIGVEAYLASLLSEIIATACYMIAVTTILKTTKTF